MAETTTLYASGSSTQTAGGAETFLSSPNVNGVFELTVDANLMAAGDVVILRVYQMVLTGGTTRKCYSWTYTDAQPAEDLIKKSPLVGNDLTDTNSLRFSIEQPFGTTRALPWKVLQY